MVDDVIETPVQAEVIDENVAATPENEDVPVEESAIDEEKQTVAPDELKAEEPEPPKEPKRKGRFQRRMDAKNATIAELQEENAALKADRATPTPAPNVDDFEDDHAFNEAQTRHVATDQFNKLEQESINRRLSQAEQSRNQSVVAGFNERAADIRAIHPDFDATLGKGHPSPAMNAAILEAEHGPEIAYHLVNNSEEEARIAAMSPTQAIMEIGRLENQFANAPPPKIQTTQAPPSHKPLGGSNANANDSLDKIKDINKWIPKRNREKFGF